MAEPGWYPDPNVPNTQRYWDGHAWTENRSPLAATAPPAPTPAPYSVASDGASNAQFAPPPKKGLSTWLVLGIVAVVLFVLVVILVGIAAVAGSGSGGAISSGSSQAACEDAAEQATRISQEQNPTSTHIIKIRSVTVVSDSRTTYAKPTGSAEATVLECKGDATFSNNSDGAVAISETVDADGAVFIKYEPIP